MILQRTRRRFSLYHARYSPLTTLSSTVMFFPCQNASFVSSTESRIVTFSTYWNEYLPCMRRFSISMPRVCMNGYSDLSVQSVILSPRQNQPNSVDSISQPLSTVSSHSRSALMPPRRLFSTRIPRSYQSAARHLSVSSEPLILRL